MHSVRTQLCTHTNIYMNSYQIQMIIYPRKLPVSRGQQVSTKYSPECVSNSYTHRNTNHTHRLTWARGGITVESNICSIWRLQDKNKCKRVKTEKLLNPRPRPMPTPLEEIKPSTGSAARGQETVVYKPGNLLV